jgi:hypothetical protein
VQLASLIVHTAEFIPVYKMFGSASAVTTSNQVKVGQPAHTHSSSSRVVPSSAFEILFRIVLRCGVGTFRMWSGVKNQKLIEILHNEAIPNN